MPFVHSIYRYPIKGLSPQALKVVLLEQGKPFPFDRVFALTRPGAANVDDGARWAKASSAVRQARAGKAA